MQPTPEPQSPERAINRQTYGKGKLLPFKLPHADNARDYILAFEKMTHLRPCAIEWVKTDGNFT